MEMGACQRVFVGSQNLVLVQSDLLYLVSVSLAIFKNKFSPILAFLQVVSPLLAH
jgi:hypothetical protein